MGGSPAQWRPSHAAHEWSLRPCAHWGCRAKSTTARAECEGLVCSRSHVVPHECGVRVTVEGTIQEHDVSLAACVHTRPHADVFWMCDFVRCVLRVQSSAD